MTMRSFLVGVLLVLMARPASAQLDQLLKGLGIGQPSGLSQAKIGSGLKEALKVGTENTIKLTAASRPVVDRTMNKVGVTRQYKALVAQYQAIPFVRTETVDIDQYVVTKSLDGLFHVLGEVEVSDGGEHRFPGSGADGERNREEPTGQGVQGHGVCAPRGVEPG